MSSKIKVGVIGAGLIGPVHVESLRRLGFAEVVGLATSGEHTAISKAKQLCIPRAYGDYQELIQDERIQVVHITSPNHLHFPQVGDALRAGKHVVCDKPLAINPQQTRQLTDLAQEKQLVNSVAFNHRFFPAVWHAKSLVEDGEVGDIYIISGGYHQDHMLYATDYNWRVQEKKGGPLRTVGDIGSHWLDMVQFVTGLEIDSVFADLATFLPVRKKLNQAEHASGGKASTKTCQEVKVNTEDYAAILLTFKQSAARGTVTLSQMCAGRKIQLFFEIFGSRSSLVWNEEEPNKLWRGFKDRPNQVYAKDPLLMGEGVRKYARYPSFFGEGYADSFAQYLTSVYEYIRDKGHRKRITPDFPTFKDGHKITLLCEAILESARQKRWVKVREY